MKNKFEAKCYVKQNEAVLWIESIFVGERVVKIPKLCPKLPCDVSFPNPSTGSGLTIPTPVTS